MFMYWGGGGGVYGWVWVSYICVCTCNAIIEALSNLFQSDVLFLGCLFSFFPSNDLKYIFYVKFDVSPCSYCRQSNFHMETIKLY